jgi:hypothetical protein
MSIPNFKSQDDWQEFLNIFDDQWQCMGHQQQGQHPQE